MFCKRAFPLARTGTFCFTGGMPTNKPNANVNVSGSYTEVTLGNLTVCFSYRTPIALHFVPDGVGPAIRASRENDWSNTTGKHLATAEREFGLSKSDRLPSEEFDLLLATVLP
jgi:hypothetical protein